MRRHNDRQVEWRSDKLVLVEVLALVLVGELGYALGKETELARASYF